MLSRMSSETLEAAGGLEQRCFTDFAACWSRLDMSQKQGRICSGASGCSAKRGWADAAILLRIMLGTQKAGVHADCSKCVLWGGD